ncbi:sporulation integral membrane protein YtvI [Clostridium sp. AF50-3]|jgi:sporulation integral membrane protein YtvI|uniref:sporulation integral membrane protein YtvI n=2 Tax=Clostridiaceae TaxID=31979 RepID=UPI000E48150D|nr:MULTISPECIES: sporulation integral membrane protein YtvI [Clostridium]MBD9273698.1 sporulation integral membrane protein YtvI [Clostridium sp.]RGH15749.1 sporulation integral membrane protein YtvI [Clostridium sp. AF12-41]RHO65762.1 sporulation integral membrane protein YtvI [Clostridium sp. AF50-3]RHP58412.1 sporulation integral membrane protein YtvI [Clostridium sp. AF29-8BH]
MKRCFRMILNIVIPLLGLCLVIFLGPRLLHFFMPFVVGWILALLANPLVRFLERRVKLVRRHGSMLIIIAALAIVIGLFYGAGLLVYREMGSFLADAPEIYQSVIAEIENALQNGRKLAEYFPQNLQPPLLAFSDNLDGLFGKLVSRAAEPTVQIAGHVAKSIPNLLVNMVIIILSSYLFLADRESIMRWLKEHLPAFVFRYIEYMKRDAKGLIGGYFLAQFRIMCVVALILAAGFLVLGVRYGVLLAFLTAILDFLPIFGTGTVLFPWAVVKLFAGEYAYATGLILLYILTQVVRQIIQPKIVGESMGLPPLMTLFLLYLGFKLRGLTGMILAVPVGLVFINFYKYGAFDSMIRNFRMLMEAIQKFRREE